MFNLREDTRSWEEFGKADEVLFYAHYSRLPEDVSGAETRVLKGGKWNSVGRQMAVSDSIVYSGFQGALFFPSSIQPSTDILQLPMHFYRNRAIAL